MVKTFFGLDGTLKVHCKHMFIGEAFQISEEGTEFADPLGVVQCTYFYQNEEIGPLPSWVNRGANSYPIKFPADCQNCPVYCADPIQKRLLDENNLRRV